VHPQGFLFRELLREETLVNVRGRAGRVPVGDAGVGGVGPAYAFEVSGLEVLRMLGLDVVGRRAEHAFGVADAELRMRVMQGGYVGFVFRRGGRRGGAAGVAAVAVVFFGGEGGGERFGVGVGLRGEVEVVGTDCGRGVGAGGVEAGGWRRRSVAVWLGFGGWRRRSPFDDCAKGGLLFGIHGEV
jgi:hypothetical protein